MLRPAIAAAGRSVAVVIDRNPRVPATFPTADVLRSKEEVASWIERWNGDLEFVIAIGGHNGAERRRVADWLVEIGCTPFTAIDPRSYVAETAIVGSGSQILPMAAVCEDARIGEQTIINTNASVDHESIIGSGVHVMPGATVAGCVTIEDDVTVGTNATIFPRVTIGRGSQVGAGAVVTRSVPPNSVVIGVPARVRR